jgi:hypothetical protein
MDIVFQREKKNPNRVKGVEVLIILAKVKNAKRVIFYPPRVPDFKYKTT